MGSVPHVQSLHGANVYHQHPFFHQGLHGGNVHCLHPHATAVRAFVEMMPTISNYTPPGCPPSFGSLLQNKLFWPLRLEEEKVYFLLGHHGLYGMVQDLMPTPHQVTLHGVTWAIPEGITTPP